MDYFTWKLKYVHGILIWLNFRYHFFQINVLVIATRYNDITSLWKLHIFGGFQLRTMWQIWILSWFIVWSSYSRILCPWIKRKYRDTSTFLIHQLEVTSSRKSGFNINFKSHMQLFIDLIYENFGSVEEYEKLANQ